jgi:hypothetical protein
MVSSLILALGMLALLLPVGLHLALGADNDAYVVIAEGARDQASVLGDWGLAWMYRPRFLVWPALLILLGLLPRVILWRRFMSVSKSV